MDDVGLGVLRAIEHDQQAFARPERAFRRREGQGRTGDAEGQAGQADRAGRGVDDLDEGGLARQRGEAHLGELESRRHARGGGRGRGRDGLAGRRRLAGRARGRGGATGRCRSLGGRRGAAAREDQRQGRRAETEAQGSPHVASICPGTCSNAANLVAAVCYHSRVGTSADVAIIGGGAIGSSIAYFLASDPGFDGRVVVIERDPTYRQASSALSASSIRQQFSTPENIRMSRFGWSFLADADRHLAVDGTPAAVDLHEAGYLYLAGRDGEPTLRANHDVQRTGGGRGRPAGPRRTRGALPLAVRGRTQPRVPRTARRGLVRRVRPPPGVPPQGPRARRRVRGR